MEKSINNDDCDDKILRVLITEQELVLFLSFSFICFIFLSYAKIIVAFMAHHNVMAFVHNVFAFHNKKKNMLKIGILFKKKSFF